MSVRIGHRNIKDIAAGQTIWDVAVPGFGARRQKSAAVSYILFYRTNSGRQRWYTIGRHGAPWVPDSAREEARRVLGLVARGEDPASSKRAARHPVTVAELCDSYLKEAEAGRLLTKAKTAKKQSTLATDRSRISVHIKPLLGSSNVTSVSKADVQRFMHEVARGTPRGNAHSGSKAAKCGGQGAAARTTGLLGAIFAYAVEENMRPDNPVHGVRRFADGRRTRRLQDSEYGMFETVLTQAEFSGVWPAAIAATKLLIFTGWRSGEVLSLRWQDVDLERRTARLRDTKTGYSLRPLSHQACAVLRAHRAPGELVFESSRGGFMAGYRKIWDRHFLSRGIPEDVTPHVLRHSFASLSSDLGMSESTTAALIGHKGQSITARYVHSADQVLLAAADAVALRISELMCADGISHLRVAS